MSPETTGATHNQASAQAVPSDHSRRRRLITALTVLAVLAIIGVAVYVLGGIIVAVVLLILSALLAYLISPLVQLLGRRLPRALAIVLAYLLVAIVLAVVMVVVLSALLQQSTALVHYIQFLISPAGKRQLQPLLDWLGKVGVTKDQMLQFENQLLQAGQRALSEVPPFLIALFGNFVSLLLTVTLSIYFVIDGPRIIHWLRFKTPLSQRDNINFLLRALDESVGGYFRGALLLALIGSLATGAGLALLRVQYAALLGMLFFFLYFIPEVGAYVIEALCVLAAIPQGWVMMLIVAVYMTLLQGIVLGRVLSPLVYRKTVGVHPIVALLALVVGAELFGLLGGFLSVPVVGVLQQIIVDFWKRWKNRHPEQFPPEE
jgi:predicted PurR-regulated permease PerM